MSKLTTIPETKTLSESNKKTCWCTICYHSFLETGFAKCDECRYKCMMCDIRQPWHTGPYKCPGCDCYYCFKHIENMEIYEGCPACWMENHCFLCIIQTVKPLWVEVWETETGQKR